ncbi:MAG: glucose-6-phosphate dehydrogenase [Deltaproteobacteria bacterium]|jgi:glucose-6-phosphate 1-dehydrogenase
MERNTADSNIVEDAAADVIAPDLELDPHECVAPGRSDPCTIVILGATGDLTTRKLMPALFDLFLNKGLPDHFLIVGSGRADIDRQQFGANMQTAVKNAGTYDEDRWPQFAEMLHYCRTDIEDPDTFKNLARSLRDLDEKFNTGGNRIFYMALPPSVFPSAATMIGQAGLADENQNGNGWSRIVVEKPFGRDLKSARDLEGSLARDFSEHQIFRIDHYVAKETVQNILMLRFANSLFEPIWNRRYVDYVAVTAIEELGVENRTAYYEQSGVLRDMFQNHMMQLLALTAMEPPSRFEADQVRDEKIKVFRALRPFRVDRLEENLVLGQYIAGRVDGKAVPAYREESGADANSLTPTFAMMKVYLDNWRWQGVPFYLTSGKRLDQKLTEIAIQFKHVPHSMFRHTLEASIAANRLILGIYPEETINLTFQTKNPGAVVCLRTVTMDFHYHQNYSGPALDAYAKALIDCMLGDQMLFWRQDAVELCWKFLDPILNRCETCDDQAELLQFYEAGSKGPEAAEKMRKA